MGFWNGKVENSFERLFDLDRDGKLNATERYLEYKFLNNEKNEDEDEYDDEYDDEEKELIDDLEMVGIDVDEFRLMDDDERMRVLEDEGLDPDDYTDF